jgi:uncharacterized membrane protein YoaK (UPF0700 family)
VRLSLRSLVAGSEHGPLPGLLLVLTLVSGIVDATSVLALDRVFVSNMTGNAVFVGFALAGASGFEFARLLPALIGFLFGAWVSGAVDLRLRRRRHIHLRNVVVGQALLFGAALVVTAQETERPRGSVVVAVITLMATAMGMQNAMARRLRVPDLPTSIVTMGLVALVSDLRRQDGAAAVRRLSAVVCLVSGACLGAVVIMNVGLAASLGLVLLILVLVAVTATNAGRAGHSDWQRRRDQPPPSAP